MTKKEPREITQDLLKRLTAKKIPSRGVFGLCKAAARAIRDLDKTVICKNETIFDLSEQLSATTVTYRGLSAHAADLEKDVASLKDTMAHLEGVMGANNVMARKVIEEKTKLLDDQIGVNNALVEEVKRLGAPVPLILFCPKCNTRHLDAGVMATTPHRTHACQACGFLWAPAVVPTVGVAFLPGCRDADQAKP